MFYFHIESNVFAETAFTPQCIGTNYSTIDTSVTGSYSMNLECAEYFVRKNICSSKVLQAKWQASESEKVMKTK